VNDPGEAIVELLRAITHDATEMRSQLLRIEQRLVDLGESLRTTFGLAAHADQAIGRSDDVIAELADEVAALKQRIEALERRH